MIIDEFIPPAEHDDVNDSDWQELESEELWESLDEPEPH